jgi:hypothetical protein
MKIIVFIILCLYFCIYLNIFKNFGSIFESEMSREKMWYVTYRMFEIFKFSEKIRKLVFTSKKIKKIEKSHDQRLVLPRHAAVMPLNKNRENFSKIEMSGSGCR